MQTTRIGGMYEIEFSYPELIVLLENLKMPLERLLEILRIKFSDSESDPEKELLVFSEMLKTRPLRVLLSLLGKKEVRIGLYKKDPGVSYFATLKDRIWLESCCLDSNRIIKIVYRIPKAGWRDEDLIDAYYLGPEDPTQFKLRDLTEEQKNALLAVLKFDKGEVQKNDCVSQEMIAVGS